MSLLLKPALFSRLALACLAAALLVTAALLSWQVKRLRNERDTLAAQIAAGARRVQEPTAPEKIQEDAPPLGQVGRGQQPPNGGGSADTQGSSEPVLATIWLPAGLVRNAAESRTLFVPRQTRVIRLDLELAEDEAAANYRAVVRTLAGDQIWSQSHAKGVTVGSRRAIRLDIPAKALPDRDYLVSLQAASPGQKDFEKLDTYSVRIRRK